MIYVVKICWIMLYHHQQNQHQPPLLSPLPPWPLHYTHNYYTVSTRNLLTVFATTSTAIAIRSNIPTVNTASQLPSPDEQHQYLPLQPSFVTTNSNQESHSRRYCYCPFPKNNDNKKTLRYTKIDFPTEVFFFTLITMKLIYHGKYYVLAQYMYVLFADYVCV